MRCSVPVESLSFIDAGHCLSLLSVLMCGVLLFEGASRTAAPLVPGPPRLQPENWWAPARELEGSITRTGTPCNSTPLNFDQSQRVPLDYNLVAAWNGHCKGRVIRACSDVTTRTILFPKKNPFGSSDHLKVTKLCQKGVNSKHPLGLTAKARARFVSSPEKENKAGSHRLGVGANLL